MKRTTSYWLRYLGHLALILAVLFIGYPVGNAILGFGTGSDVVSLAKMFGWFYGLLLMSDLLFEKLLRV